MGFVSYAKSFTEFIWNYAAEPLFAAGTVTLGALRGSYNRCCRHRIKKINASYYERNLFADQIVPHKTSDLVKKFLNEKGIDSSKIALAKNLERKDPFAYAMSDSSTLLHNFCVIRLPTKAIDRIEQENKLNSVDQFFILHECGHDILDDYSNLSVYFPLKTGMVRLVTYVSVAAIGLSYFSSIGIGQGLAYATAHILGCTMAKVSLIYENHLRHEMEYRADREAAKFGNDILEAGIKTFDITKKQLSDDIEKSELDFINDTSVRNFLIVFNNMIYFKNSEDVRFPLLETHPSDEQRKRKLIKLLAKAD